MAPSERLTTIAFIASNVGAHLKAGRVATPAELFRVMERILALTTENSSFITNNIDTILDLDGLFPAALKERD